MVLLNLLSIRNESTHLVVQVLNDHVTLVLSDVDLRHLLNRLRGSRFSADASDGRRQRWNANQLLVSAVVLEEADALLALTVLVVVSLGSFFALLRSWPLSSRFRDLSSFGVFV